VADLALGPIGEVERRRRYTFERDLAVSVARQAFARLDEQCFNVLEPRGSVILSG